MLPFVYVMRPIYFTKLRLLCILIVNFHFIYFTYSCGLFLVIFSPSFHMLICKLMFCILYSFSFFLLETLKVYRETSAVPDLHGDPLCVTT